MIIGLYGIVLIVAIMAYERATNVREHMRLHIRIKTPKGQAKGTESKLRAFLLGKSKVIKAWSNKADDKFYWIVDAYHGDISRITRNVSMYGWFIHKVFSSGAIKKVAKMALGEKDQEELRRMLEDNTKIEIITPTEINEDILSNADTQNQPSESL